MSVNWNKRTYSKESFIEAFDNSINWSDMARKLNLKPKNLSIPSFKKAALELGLDISKFDSKRYKYTNEKIIEAVENSHSVAGVIRFLGLKMTGSNHNYLTKLIKELKVDTSHFTGHAHNKGKTFPKKEILAKEILVLSTPDRREKRHKLVKCMIEVGIDYVCNSCKLEPLWNGKELTLEVNHINGMFWDNRQENLEFLCPNCHSQETETNRSYKYKNNETPL